MEVITKKTITAEFEGTRYAIPDDSTIEELLVRLGLPKDKKVQLYFKNGGFVLVCNN